MAQAVLIAPFNGLARWNGRRVLCNSAVPKGLAAHLKGREVKFPLEERATKDTHATVYRPPGRIRGAADLLDALMLIAELEEHGVSHVVPVRYMPGIQVWR